jgi:hypothetical protein
MSNLTKELTGQELADYLAKRFPKDQTPAQFMDAIRAEAMENDQEEEEPEEFETISEWEARDQYDQMLDDCFPEVDICGYKWNPSTALKRVDEIAYNCGFSDYVSSLESDGILVEGY